MRPLLPSLAIVALLPSLLHGQTLTAIQIRRIDSVFAAFDRTDRPGCAVGVSRGGEVVYERGYGMSNLEYGLAITPGSIFHVASISKQFTGFAVGLLADQGKLSLDDDVRKYIPELPNYGQTITLRHLLYHTSGIRDQWELLRYAGWREDDPITEDDILRIVTRQRALNFNPSTEDLYSNSGFTLLAIIVKRVSGQSLRDFSARNIFAPLGMRNTHFHDDHSMIVLNRTSAYEERPGGGWKISIPVFDNSGATSLFTTPGDLLLWEKNFDHPRIGSAKYLTDAQTPGRLLSGKEINYGFGLGLETYRGARAVGHGGADAGYRADVVRFPEHAVAIAVTCNFASAVPGTYARQIADVVLDGTLGPVAAGASFGPAVTLTPAQRQEVAGVYRRPNGDEVWTFVVRDTTLVLANFGLPLKPLGPRRFSVQDQALVEFTVPSTEGDTAMQAKVTAGSDVIGVYRRVPEYRPTAQQLRAFAGEYWSDDLGVAYQLVVRDSGLVLQRWRFPDTPLKPVFQDAFMAGDLGTVRFLLVGGRATGFVLTGGRVRGVRFDRRAQAVGR